MLVLANSVQAYFREALDEAIRTSNVVVTEPAQVYLIHLLNEFSRSENAFAGVDPGEKPNLAHMLERAYSADSREALSIFRHLGDTSLYLLGYFKESRKSRIVSDSYYKDIGAQAYSCASNLSRAHAAHSAAVFLELAENFGGLVKVLEHTASYCQTHETH
jgi:hypothetical protein